jgi:putative FmdB family regulatory protein
MPTYDYVCAACDHAFEYFQSMTSRRLRKCPSCGQPRLERLVGSGAGVIFKGSGFYETDYKRAGKSAANEEKSSAKPAKEGETSKDAPKKDGSPSQGDSSPGGAKD